MINRRAGSTALTALQALLRLLAAQRDLRSGSELRFGTCTKPRCVGMRCGTMPSDACWRTMENLRSVRRKALSAPVSLIAFVMSLLWLPAAAAQEAAKTRGRESEPVAGWIDSALHWTVRAIEIVGIATIVIGAIAATAIYLYRTVVNGPAETEFHSFRAALGRSILLGLEFLVAADIINTVAIDPTLESVAVLAAIVLVRTFLSFALEVEIDGQWPWKKSRKQSESS